MSMDDSEIEYPLSRCTQCAKKFCLRDDLDANEKPIICGTCVGRILNRGLTTLSPEPSKGHKPPPLAREPKPRIKGVHGSAYYRELKKLQQPFDATARLSGENNG